MKYYKAVLTITGRKNIKKERIIYTSGTDITTALNTTHKIRKAKWEKIREISRDEYIKGVSDKEY